MRLSHPVILCSLWVGPPALASPPEPSGSDPAETLERRDDEAATLEAAELESRGLHFGASAAAQGAAPLPFSDGAFTGVVAAFANYRWPSIDLRASLGFVPLVTVGRTLSSLNLGGSVELQTFFRLTPRFKLGVGGRMGVLAANVRSQCTTTPCTVPPIPVFLFGLKASPVVVVLGERRNVEAGLLLSIDVMPSASMMLSNGTRYMFSGGVFVSAGLQLSFLAF